MTVCGRYQCQKKLHNTINEVTYSKIKIPAVREGDMQCVWRNETWRVGCEVSCLAAVHLTNRHIRRVICKTKGGFVSNDRQSRATRQARDIFRCSTVCVSSDIANIPVTGRHYTGGNTPKYLMRETNSH
jgi:hypothetical protein